MQRHTVSLTRRSVLKLGVASLCALAMPLPACGAAAAGWEPTGLMERAFDLFTPASGAFFARTTSGLMRSDDGGATWRPAPLPPGVAGERWAGARVAVDPNDHARLFVGGWVTRDDAASWSPLGPWAENPEADVWPLPSGADPSLVYAAVRVRNDVEMHRSRDGGATWERFLELPSWRFRPGSAVRATLFQAHPSDPAVLFHSVVGFRGAGNQGVVRRSADQGQTDQEVLYKAVRIPRLLVGGRGVVPGRMYAALVSDEESSTVHRSEDDGLTWAEVAAFGEAGAPVAVRGIGYDPSAPDRVWVGLRPGGVRMSEDGGHTWAEASPTDWEVGDVALGIDGANLYAATEAGVLRLPLR